jgi:hypothetical protein
VFGDPLHPVHVRERYRSDRVVELAKDAYYNRRPDFMLNPEKLKMLATELENLGCHEASILDHLRHGDQHVQGCWVLDLILGKV